MGNDFRRDHSFRVPRPDLTALYGTPNTCNGCHADQSAGWASDAIVKWYGPDRAPHFSPAFAAAQSGDLSALPELMAMVGDTTYPEVIMASAIEMFGNLNTPETNQKVRESLNSENPMLRFAAINALSGASQDQRFRAIAPMLNDTIRAVRTQAAYALADIPETLFTGTTGEAFREASKEFESVLKVQADFPAGQMLRGQYYHKQNQLDLAEKAYAKASEMDPYLAQPFYYIANLQYGKKDFQGAKKSFQKAIENDSNYIDAYYSLGLLLAERNDLQGASTSLRKAAELSGNPRYYYNWGLTLQNLKKPAEAEMVYLKALEIDPYSEANLYALTILYIQEKAKAKAKVTYQRLISLNPQNPEYLQLGRALQ
jgi:tetratricopeptide (TPR) repeat protein